MNNYFTASPFTQKLKDGIEVDGYEISYDKNQTPSIFTHYVCEVVDEKNQGKNVKAIADEIVRCLNELGDTNIFDKVFNDIKAMKQ